MKVLRARSVGGAGSGNLRRALVVFQFGVSIVLIVGTMTIYNQMSLIRTQNLGFSRENVVSARLEGGAREQFESFKATLKQNPAILDVTTADDNPYNVNTSTTDPDYDGKDPDDNSLFYMVASGYDYLKTLKMELVAGRDFTPDQRMDSANVIINETAAKKLGFDNKASLLEWLRILTCCLCTKRSSQPSSDLILSQVDCISFARRQAGRSR
jgi:putative ABC transport system permease protein